MSEQDNQINFTKVLDKLVDSFDDFKERLIRIEENVKDVKNVKIDVEELKIGHAKIDSKATSAHKRLDSLEEERIKNIENNQTWLWRSVVAAVITVVSGVLFL